MGIQPDFVITRGERYLDQRRKDRLALFCNMQKDDIISSPDLPSVYEIPFVLHKQELEKKIMTKLGLTVREQILRIGKNLSKVLKIQPKPLRLRLSVSISERVNIN